MIYQRLLTEFGMLVFFINLRLVEFQVRCLTLFLLFSVIDGFEWFCIESLVNNIQLMLEFLKAQFLVLHFLRYLLMTFLIMLPVILLSMLMILVFILSMIRYLISGNNFNLLLSLNLICKIWWTGARSGLLISLLEKLNWFLLTSLITLMTLFMWKWMGLFLSKNYILRCWNWPSLLNWIWVLTLSLLLKLPLLFYEVSFPWGCSVS